MARLADERSTSSVVLVDATVLRDIGAALNGTWRPADEEDSQRAERLLAAARLRLYVTRDRTGWLLVTMEAPRDAVLRRGDADWSIGYLPVLEAFEEAPDPTDAEAMANLLHREKGIEAEAAATLAAAVLCDQIDVIVTDDVRRYRHDRPHDLPERLEIVTPGDLLVRMDLRPGEAPAVDIPDGVLSLLDDEPWWVP